MRSCEDMCHVHVCVSCVCVCVTSVSHTTLMNTAYCFYAWFSSTHERTNINVASGRGFAPVCFNARIYNPESCIYERSPLSGYLTVSRWLVFHLAHSGFGVHHQCL